MTLTVAGFTRYIGDDQWQGDLTVISPSTLAVLSSSTTSTLLSSSSFHALQMLVMLSPMAKMSVPPAARWGEQG